jgi:hypothetical protein
VTDVVSRPIALLDGLELGSPDPAPGHTSARRSSVGAALMSVGAAISWLTDWNMREGPLMIETIDVGGYRIDLDVLYRAMYEQSVVEVDGTRVFHGNSPDVRAMKRLLNDLFDVPVRDTIHPINNAARTAATERLRALNWATKDGGRSGRYVLHPTSRRQHRGLVATSRTSDR